MLIAPSPSAETAGPVLPRVRVCIAFFAYRWFTEPAARAVSPPEELERHDRQLVADLRAAAGRRAGDCERLELLRVLGTEEFPTDAPVR